MDLYKQMNEIKEREAAESRAEVEKKAAFFAKKSYGTQMPVPSKKHENKAAFGQNSEMALIEWEKNQIKPLFKVLDVEKKGIAREDLVQIMEQLSEDQAIIGKVPYVTGEFASLFVEWPELITWEHFRENCNQWEWRQTDLTKL